MIWPLIALVAVIVIVILIYMVLRNVILLAINSVIGFFALFGFNYVFGTDVQINIWSVLITVIGGVIGFAIVVVSHFLGWAF
jgi:hypothetical protein